MVGLLIISRINFSYNKVPSGRDMNNENRTEKVSGVIERFCINKMVIEPQISFWDVAFEIYKGLCKSYPFNPLQNLYVVTIDWKCASYF